MINVALLGFGRIGQMHAQNIYLNKTLNLLYVYEKINKLGKKAQNLYNCKIEKNYKKIVDDILENIKSLQLSPSVLEELVQKHYAENKKIISLEGNLLRLAMDQKYPEMNLLNLYR